MTTRTLNPLLQADRLAGVVTFTRMLQVLAEDGTTLGMCELDKALEYDTADASGPWAGVGELRYLPDPGFDPTELEFANDLSVDGGEQYSLIPLDAIPLQADDIRAGKWTNARFRVLEVNYADLSHGHEVLHEGYWGNITLRQDALLIIQLDGLTMPLRQNLCPLTSATCRSVHGSQESEALEPCGFDVTPLWVEGTVTAVDPDDSARSFTASGLTAAAGEYFPGGLIWLSGGNASNKYWGVDSHDAGGVVGLRREMPRAIQVGDTFKIRGDCTKQVEGDKGCRHYFGDEWVYHFNGEPDVNKAVNAQVPGARVGPGNGGRTTASVETAPE